MPNDDLICLSEFTPEEIAAFRALLSTLAQRQREKKGGTLWI